ncbi:DUF2076 domain-containing protein [Pandoraea sp. NPDC087047]|uniref:DUF2076 domain-containing protein n=1 Tax=Pandoraea sp. NPDC087047 TaxID=3364390 RepID=UPI003815A44C
MNQQELQALQGFLTQLTQAQAGVKDEQAQALIADAVHRQPDAAYLLVQRALLLDHALASARAQIATLQSQVSQLQAAQGGAHDSFLGGANAWGNSGNAGGYNGGYNAGAGAAPAPNPAQMQAPVQASAPAPVQAPVPSAAPAQRSGWLGDGARSTLGSIATTAAGVAGGAFLFQGIESLFHRGGGGFFGQPAMGGGMMPSETIINNTIYEDGNGGGNGIGNGNGNGFFDTSNSDFSNIDDGLMDSGDYDDDSNFI